ncbi:hypothetical protein FRZ67_04660 [Panacibacter ginsenosidivorans]|uniref:PKD/Chitinase domain-containing protein n=1 Tax=Panacibacter ginsenosidivorans TaxID=1813871 RepID=A0A5B8V6V4_9BACT|nr:PKD domain-containing protein [Panacibacter ginsenosidivorans]QEC66623.1 hypothetical protein FRZ67_04660 [Panacibacter ginsenosidivorans]
MKKTCNPFSRLPILIVILLLFTLVQSCKKDDTDTPANKVPVADAGTAAEIPVGEETFTLSGTGTDADGTITAYLWSQVSGPNHAIITNPGSTSTDVKYFEPGTYLFQLMVTDDDGATGVDTVSIIVLAPVCTETGRWIGTYATENETPVIVTDDTFIKDGIAQLTNSPWSYFFCSMQLEIPSCRVIDADSVRLEVSLKNPSTGVHAITDYDAGLWLQGSADTAVAQYIGYRPEFTKFGLMGAGFYTTSDLLYVFENWTTVTLEANNGVLTTKRDGVITQTTSYSGHTIGQLKHINISFKGSGSIDWVKLYSSNSNKLLMQEDFNTNGASNVHWY